MLCGVHLQPEVGRRRAGYLRRLGCVFWRLSCWWLVKQGRPSPGASADTQPSLQVWSKLWRVWDGRCDETPSQPSGISTMAYSFSKDLHRELDYCDSFDEARPTLLPC